LAKRFKRYEKKRDTTPQLRINDRIRLPKVRLVGNNFDDISTVAGKKMEPGIVDTRDAKKWADELDLDLVEINPKADPPVCKIIDYQKFLYQKKKKEKELKAKTSKTVIKEIRFGPNTDEHDFDFKLRHAKKFLADGAKVKAYVFFKGRTIVFKDRGELLLLKFLQELEEFGAAESLPKMEGRRMIVMVSPKKKNKK
jgi:translation initiation factor IF-3